MTDTAWWAVAAGVAVAAVVLDPAWRQTRVVVTVAHELGHALSGVLAGRKLTALRVRLDASGVTHTRGKARGVGMVVCAWSGYPAPALAGLAAVFVAVQGWAPQGLLVLGVLFVGCLLWARSVFTVMVLLACAGACAALWWYADAALQGAVAVGMGVFLVLGGLRSVGEAWRGRHSHRARGESDAVALELLTRVPSTVWLATFWLVTVACAAGAGWLLWTDASTG